MTRDEANRLIGLYFDHANIPNIALNRANLGGIDWVNGMLYFEWDHQTGELIWRAKVHRFRNADHPDVMPRIQEAVRQGEDTGGGELEYHAPSRGIFLTRIYVEVPSELDAYLVEIDRLAAGGLRWFEGRFREIVNPSQPPSAEAMAG